MSLSQTFLLTLDFGRKSWEERREAESNRLPQELSALQRTVTFKA